MTRHPNIDRWRKYERVHRQLADEIYPDRKRITIQPMEDKTMSAIADITKTAVSALVAIVFVVGVAVFLAGITGV